MAKKRKTLPEDFQEIIDSGDMDKFKAVFDKCEVSATARSRTTENAFSFKGLTEEHVTFLAENGIDLNADCGTATNDENIHKRVLIFVRRKM